VRAHVAIEQSPTRVCFAQVTGTRTTELFEPIGHVRASGACPLAYRRLPRRSVSTDPNRKGHGYPISPFTRQIAAVDRVQVDFFGSAIT
jgi:hypothetical protein